MGIPSNDDGMPIFNLEGAGFKTFQFVQGQVAGPRFKPDHGTIFRTYPG